MGTLLELVYQYRQIMGRRDAGSGLDFDDIDALARIETTLGPPPPIGARDWLLADAPAARAALLRGYRIDDEVALVNLGPEGCVCRRAPYAEEGMGVEVVVDQRGPQEQRGQASSAGSGLARPAISYRFRARVAWLQDDEDDFALGLEFVGVPVQVRYRVVGALAEGDADRVAA